MTLLSYKGNIYRLAVEKRVEFFKLVMAMDDVACRWFLDAYAVKA